MYPDIYAYCRQGEDGPTHQPVEMLESLRAMPNLLVIRPADGNEVCGYCRLIFTTGHSYFCGCLIAVRWLELMSKPY